MSGPFLHVITGLGTGGAETALARLLAADDRARREPLVVSLGTAGTVGPRLAQLGIEVVALGMRPGRPSVSALRRLARLIRRRHPALIQGWMYHGNVVAAVAARIARSRSPVVWNVRHSLPDLAQEKRSTALLIRVGRRFRSVRKIVYNSRTAARQHEALGYPAERTVVIPNGFDTARFRPDPRAREALREELGIAPGTALVGLVARFHPVKDHDTFLGAAQRLAAEHPRLRFVLAGPGVDGDNADLVARVEGRGLGGRAHLLGERRDPERIHAALDVATCSSVGEGLPNAIGEALACGVPCVVTDVGDSAELIGECGVVVPPRDPGALAEAVSRLLALPDRERLALGSAGRARIETRYGLPRVVAAYATLYDELLARPAAASGPQGAA